MAEPDDKDLDAAERALGTEPRDKESAEQRRAREAWDARLAPLALAAPPAEPPADMFDRISRGLDGGSDTSGVVLLAERRARRWRGIAIVSSAVAASLALWIAITPIGPVVPPMAPRQSYVALVTPEGGGGPALVVEVDFPDTESRVGIVTVRSLEVAAPEGRDLELWRVPAGGAPQSLGLLEDYRLFAKANVAVEPGDTLAVSVEPPGGSPTGAPTGPVILSGPLVETR
jgi:anti-sigma-K factor RskA